VNPFVGWSIERTDFEDVFHRITIQRRCGGDEYWQEPGDDAVITVAPLTKFAIGALTFFIFVFGIFPQPILKSLIGVPIETRLVTEPVAQK
jgi:hypothetical protein